MKIINVVGARPNFMKMAPIIEAMNKYPKEIDHLLVHTGQHYDEKMSRAFFEDLGMPKPDVDLGVGSGSHAEQTAKIMVAFEKVCEREQPDLVMVVGDVNSTMACTITAKKLGVKVAHVEAGLRSGDMEMPEEINRLCTDVLCDYLFTTDRFANENLRAEGVDEKKIVFVGNVMIDTLMKHRDMAKGLDLMDSLGIARNTFTLVTMHRPANVDDKEILKGILETISAIGEQLPVIFPIHPRTRKMIERFGFQKYFSVNKGEAGIRLVEPLGYLDFLHLTMNAKMVLTDSGGIQEETTVLGVPCITMRHNTERPITCVEGTNVIVGNDPDAITEAARAVLQGRYKKGIIPKFWDGMAAGRIVQWLVGKK